MSLNFITGAPGSGKTTVSGEIAKHGFAIYDTDDPNRTGIAGWHNIATGEYVAGFNELELTEESISAHMWKLTDEALADFSSRALTETIYLCGRLREAQAVIDASEHLVFLTVSGSTIQERLEARAQKPGEVEWGREAWQVERSIAVNQEIEEEYRRLGAIMIDAEQPAPVVAQNIIETTA